MSKIYHLLDEAEPFSELKGGAISRWAANMLRVGDETIVCPSFDNSWGFAADRLFRLTNWELCHQIHPLLYRSPWAIQKPIYVRVLMPLIERMNRDDILYIHNRPECVDALSLIAQQRGIQLVLHMHNSLLHPRSKKHFSSLRNVPIVFCSEFLRNEATAAYPGHFNRTHVVYNGADHEKFRADDRPERRVPQIIYTGRIVPHKGVHVLMDAMRVLERKGISATCTIVGGSAFGGSRPTSYIRKLHRTRPNNTELIGYRAGAELATLLREADIYCCPSIWNDPFPMSLLEAMASGLPVVASKTGGIPEELAHGGGVMVPPEDKDALAEALVPLLNDPAYREKMGNDALQAFNRHFLWDSVRSQYRSVIGGLVS